MKKIIIDGKEVSIEAASAESRFAPGKTVSDALDLGYFEPEARRIAENAVEERVGILDLLLWMPEACNVFLEAYLKNAKNDLVLSSTTVKREFDQFWKEKGVQLK